MAALLAGRCLSAALLQPKRSYRATHRVYASDQQDPRAKSSKGKNFQDKRRRKGRPAHLRSPYDTPLRDGNRDRLIGLLTDRAAKTLLCYLMETNLPLYVWFESYVKENPIPVVGKTGTWADISGETFLRNLLSMSLQESRANNGKEAMYDCSAAITVDPRSLAQRVMDIRTELAREFIQDLSDVAEENSHLLRETLQGSLANMMASLEDPSSSPGDASPHPELSDASVHPEVAEVQQQEKPQSNTTSKSTKKWQDVAGMLQDDAARKQEQQGGSDAALQPQQEQAASPAVHPEVAEMQQVETSSSEQPGVADLLLQQLQQRLNQQGPQASQASPAADVEVPAEKLDGEQASSPGVVEMLLQQLRRQQQGQGSVQAGDAEGMPEQMSQDDARGAAGADEMRAADQAAPVPDVVASDGNGSADNVIMSDVESVESSSEAVAQDAGGDVIDVVMDAADDDAA